MAERNDRPPRPERQHPLSNQLYMLSRVFGTLFTDFMGTDAEAKQFAKSKLLRDLDACKRSVEAL